MALHFTSIPLIFQAITFIRDISLSGLHCRGRTPHGPLCFARSCDDAAAKTGAIDAYNFFSEHEGRCLHLSARLKSLLRRYFLPLSNILKPVQSSYSYIVTAVYLLNPYSLLTCIARSTTALDNAVLLGALSAAATGNATFSLISLAVAAHTSFYPIVLLAPIIILLGQTDTKQTKKALVLQSLLLFVTSTIAIGVFNFLILGDSWIWKSLGTILEVTNLTPNVGMWWYFFTEMFDHFRTFFLGVFQLHTVIYISPICIRMVDRPLDSILLLLAIFVTWKSFPALGDMGLCAGLIGCFPDILANLRHPLFSLTVHLYTSVLLPLLHSLWLLTGTGNANFFYAATMVYGLNASLVIVDMLGASMRVEVKERVTLERASDQSGEQDKEECIDSVCENWEVRKWHAVQFTK
ncbi:uncharacterized protein IAS62_002035 [Cryptococcus decagattii]|uniref:Phosphatidylinositol glycan, class U n=1 Tax=Cryptococcus decagattii TaxID=1859122 RepID=A0ABZ2AQF4_9TREE